MVGLALLKFSKVQIIGLGRAIGAGGSNIFSLAEKSLKNKIKEWCQLGGAYLQQYKSPNYLCASLKKSKYNKRKIRPRGGVYIGGQGFGLCQNVASESPVYFIVVRHPFLRFLERMPTIRGTNKSRVNTFAFY